MKKTPRHEVAKSNLRLDSKKNLRQEFEEVIEGHRRFTGSIIWTYIKEEILIKAFDKYDQRIAELERENNKLGAKVIEQHGKGVLVTEMRLTIQENSKKYKELKSNLSKERVTSAKRKSENEKLKIKAFDYGHELIQTKVQLTEERAVSKLLVEEVSKSWYIGNMWPEDFNEKDKNRTRKEVLAQARKGTKK